MKKIYKFTSILMFMVISFSACSKKPTETPTPTPIPVEDYTEASTSSPNSINATPADSGTLKLSMRMPHTLNPLLNEDITVDKILKLIFEPLVELDKSQKPVPNLAQSFTFSPDGLSCTIVLKDNLVWSDNEPIVADDITYSLETIMSSSDDSIYKNAIENVSGFEAIDHKTAIIYYNEPSLSSPYNLCFPIIPKHYYDIPENNSPESPINMTPIGSGLYKFDDYESLKELNLSINNQSFRETPQINKIKVLITSDKETDLYAFSQGIIDSVDCDLNLWGKYQGAKEPNIDEYTSSYYEFIGFNFNNMFLQDKNVRTAIAYSINVDEIISKVYLNHAERAYTPISSSSWLYEPKTAVYNQDIAKAEQILKLAGYSDANANGILDKTIGDIVQDINFKIIVNAENDERYKIAMILSENLKKLHIESQVVVLPFAEYEAALKSGDFDIFIGGFNMNFVPDLSFAFYSGSIPENGGQNYFKYSNPQLDALLVNASTNVSPDATKQNLGEIQKLIADDLPCISLVYKKTSLLTDKRVLGEKKPLENNIYTNINEWYISK